MPGISDLATVGGVAWMQFIAETLAPTLVTKITTTETSTTTYLDPVIYVRYGAVFNVWVVAMKIDGPDVGAAYVVKQTGGANKVGSNLQLISSPPVYTSWEDFDYDDLTGSFFPTPLPSADHTIAFRATWGTAVETVTMVTRFEKIMDVDEVL